MLGQAEHGRARLEGVGHGLRPRARNRATGEGGRSHSSIVDDAVADHLDHFIFHRDRICRHFRDLPGQLVGAGEVLGGFIGADVMLLHFVIPWSEKMWAGKRGRGRDGHGLARCIHRHHFERAAHGQTPGAGNEFLRRHLDGDGHGCAPHTDDLRVEFHDLSDFHRHVEFGLSERAITTGQRARRVAATKAAFPIMLRALPPNSVP